MSKKTRSSVLLIAGVLICLASLAADSIGLGGYPGLGWKQILGAVVGVGLAAVGMLGLRRP